MATDALYGCVTANLEKGDKPGVDSWLTPAICSRPALVFRQEFNKPDVLEPLAEEHGYYIVWPQRLEARWWIASWIMVRNDLTVTAPDDLTRDLLQPFSSYVAAAHVELPGIGATTMVSVHASPNTVTDADLGRWPADPPRPRSGGIGVRNAGKLFYSDLIVDALRQMADRHPVLAAGDLNEARSWDEAHPGETWGAEFFGLVSRVGLVDVTYGLWGEERRTRYHATQGAYQLDYVLAIPDISAAVVSAEIRAAWLQPDLDVAMVADHSPIWFNLDLRGVSGPAALE